jgi:hypothetical protein
MFALEASRDNSLDPEEMNLCRSLAAARRKASGGMLTTLF